METIKTAAIVVLLLAVLFGLYTVLNQPDPKPPKELAMFANSGADVLNLEIGTGEDAKQTAAPSLPKPPPSFDSIGTKADEKLSLPKPTPLPDLPEVPNLNTGSSGNTSRPNWDSKPLPPIDSNSGSGNTSSLPPLNIPPLNEPPRRDLSRDLGPTMGTHSPSNPNMNSPPPASARNDLPVVLPSGIPELPTRGETSPLPEAPQVQDNPFFNKPPANAPPPLNNGAGTAATTANPARGSAYAKVSGFDRAAQTAETQFAAGQWREALIALSAAYRDPNLTTAEREKLLNWLDPLAGKVVYSTEHLLVEPHEVQRGETLPTIANRYNVPWQLLQNINNIRNPEFLIPGTRLKVVRGPFRAEVDLAGKELTMYVQEMYAGRFPISVGFDPAPAPGEYEVLGKEPGRMFYSRDGRNLAVNDPQNPYGRCWIDLGRDLCIHGSSSVETGNPAQGCISLSPRDADDVFGILSHGSKVSIRR